MRHTSCYQQKDNKERTSILYSSRLHKPTGLNDHLYAQQPSSVTDWNDNKYWMWSKQASLYMFNQNLKQAFTLLSLLNLASLNQSQYECRQLCPRIQTGCLKTPVLKEMTVLNVTGWISRNTSVKNVVWIKKKFEPK